jgi:mRNA-degrading endonuclease RelE of RelBE toxin-antitoxin system
VDARFTVEFTSRALRDLSKLPPSIRYAILRKTKILERDPFPKANVKKKVRGLSRPIFRLRVSTPSDTFRVFYGIHENTVLVLRVVPKKQADKILKVLKKKN